MATGDVLGVGISGLQVFQRTLSTIGHNISNSNTEGYSRQRTEITTRYPIPSGDGFLGAGVRTTTTTRLFDQNAINQVRSRTATSEFFSVYNEFASQVDNLVADADAGLTPAIEAFFISVQGVADDPSSIPAREVMMSEARALESRFDTIDSWFSDLRKAVNDRITNQVVTVNALAESIADLNNEILVATGIGGGQPPNDLLDKRDVLIDELSKHIGVSIVETSVGTLDVFIGSGQSLVLGTRSMELLARPDPDDPANVEVTYVDPTSNSVASISNMLTGGDLGGVLRFREQILLPAQNSVGRIAIAIANTFNTQHTQGLDLNNNLGANFFNEPPLGASPSVNNVSAVTASVTLNDISALTTDEYKLSYDGANYFLRNLSTNQVTTLTVASGPVPTVFNTVFGMDITLSGTPTAGDVFNIRPARDAARQFAVAITDSNLIAAAHPLRTGAQTSTNLGDAKISEATIVDPTDPNLLETVTITFGNSGGLASPADADQFDVVGVGTGNPAGVAYTSGGVITYNGWEITISGTPRVGDVYTVTLNTSGVSDNRNALALANLQNTGTLIGGNATYHDAYSQMVVLVGNLTHQSEINFEAQDALLKQSKELRESISGVNLDEEAANMLRFQQAYAAAAQVITAADNLFQTLLNAVRR